MFEIGTKLIRIETGQHYIIEKTELSKVTGRLFKKEILYHLKSNVHSSLDLIVHDNELVTLFKCEKQTNADRIRAISDEDKLETLTHLFEQTFEWGCNDRAKCLYANAVYSIISGNEIYKECEQEFVDYMHENGIH